MSNNKLVKVALGSLMALSTVGLVGCGSHEKPVSCHGVAKGDPNKGLLMTAGECEKLAGGRADPIASAEQTGYKPYPDSAYIKCYGVAAGSKNDCGTKTSACAGTAKKPKRPDAWIAFPEKLCEAVGGRVEKPSSAEYWKINKKTFI